MSFSSAGCCSVSGCSGIKRVGGHIVLGKEGDSGASSAYAGMLKGSNRVFIVPICGGCNPKSGNFTFARDTWAVQLLGFFFDEDVQKWRQDFENKFGVTDSSEHSLIGKAWSQCQVEYKKEYNKVAFAGINVFDRSHITSK